jgi:hypothetical protein
MKTKFVSAMRYLILSLCVINVVELVLYYFTYKIFFIPLSTYPELLDFLGGLLIFNVILAVLFAHIFQKPGRDLVSWLTLVTIWGFNIYAWIGTVVLHLSWGSYFVTFLIAFTIDFLAFFPYEHFQKREVKTQ